MTLLPEIKGVLVGPCQECDQVKRKLYLCGRFHKTCVDCEELRKHKIPNAQDESRSTTRRVRYSPPMLRENSSKDLEIFCKTCDRLTEAALITLPATMLDSDLAETSNLVKAIEKDQAANEDLDDTGFEIIPSEGSFGDDTSGRDLDNMRTALENSYCELKLTRELLDKVSLKTEKLEMDLDIVRGGFTFVFFDFATILKGKEVRIEERNCGIPFVLMVRLRPVAQVPHLGLFIALEKSEGRAHSPLMASIVLRAHNVFGEVIEELTFATFERGQCVHPCFDLTKPHDADSGSMYGYPDFLEEDRILEPEMLKEERLCLSFQIKPLHWTQLGIGET